MASNVKSKIAFICGAVILFICFLTKSELAVNINEINGISNRWFYIKNSYTGKYLDVYNGYANAGTNVQQCKYNGSYAQKWYFYHIGNGEYFIASDTGSTNDGEYTYFNFVLDVVNGINEDGTNIHIWEILQGDPQKFAVTSTGVGTYVIRTKSSNWEKCLSLASDFCSDGVNVEQRTYNGDVDQEWILEPVNRWNSLGVRYAEECYNKRTACYPNCSDIGGDCANFVSQCLLAAGKHINSDWYMDKKNNVYQTPAAGTTQLDASWDYTYAWINADEFRKYWKENAVRTYACSGKKALEDMFGVYAQDYVAGDVIQYGDSFLGLETSTEHTMYITGYKTQIVDGTLYPSYTVTYHSSDTLNKPLTELYQKYSNKYFRMYQIH